ncbi:MAG: hypothetical protein Q7T49_02440 [bacterium]|nr:hypothetical protein [bacterium]
MRFTPFLFGPVTETLITNGRHDPVEFYQTRKGLKVSESFRNLVLCKAQPTESGVTFRVKTQILAYVVSESEVENKLGDKRFFDESAVCAIIAELIVKQSNGEDGILRLNEDANFFHLSSCLVCVRWNYVDREWTVYAGHRNPSLGWSGGDQVFSPQSMSL